MPRRNAARKPRSSSSTAGTARPNSASHANPGRMKAVASAGTGAKTRTPVTKASASEPGRRPATSAKAATYEAVTRREPTVTTRTSRSIRSSGATATTRIAGGIPSASEGQKRLPYERTSSATSCPTVRVSGGSGGGSSRRELRPDCAVRVMAARYPTSRDGSSWALGTWLRQPVLGGCGRLCDGGSLESELAVACFREDRVALAEAALEE